MRASLNCTSAEDHAATIKEIELQLKEAAGTTWQDSIYRYTYMLGRAVWKSQNADAGLVAAERIAALVKHRQERAAPARCHGRSGADCSSAWAACWIAARADSAAMVFADAHKEVPLIRRGKHAIALGSITAQMGDNELSLKYYLEAKAVYGEVGHVAGIGHGGGVQRRWSAYWHLGENRKAEEEYKQALAFGIEQRPEA